MIDLFKFGSYTWLHNPFKEQKMRVKVVFNIKQTKIASYIPIIAFENNLYDVSHSSYNDAYVDH